MTTKTPAVKGTRQESQNTTGTTDDVEDARQILPQPDLSNVADSDLSLGTNLQVVDCEEQNDDDNADADTQPLVADSDPPTARRYPRRSNRQRPARYRDDHMGHVPMREGHM